MWHADLNFAAEHSNVCINPPVSGQLIVCFSRCSCCQLAGYSIRLVATILVSLFVWLNALGISMASFSKASRIFI